MSKKKRGSQKIKKKEGKTPQKKRSSMGERKFAEKVSWKKLGTHIGSSRKRDLRRKGDKEPNILTG